MIVRCNQCGQENNPEYRYCGMCGATLQPPPPVAAGRPPERVRSTLSGPSFLGLADEPERNVDYLLEDDPGSGHWRVFVALFLLLVSGALLVWHWRRDGYPWAALRATRAALSRTPAASSPAPTSPSPAQPAATTPEDGHTTAAPEKTEVAQQQPAPESQAAGTAGAVPQAKPSDSPPAQQGGSPEAAESSPKQSTESAAKPEEASPAAKEKAESPAAPISKPPEAKPPPAAPSTSYEDQLV